MALFQYFNVHGNHVVLQFAQCDYIKKLFTVFFFHCFFCFTSMPLHFVVSLLIQRFKVKNVEKKMVCFLFLSFFPFWSAFSLTISLIRKLIAFCRKW